MDGAAKCRPFPFLLTIYCMRFILKEFEMPGITGGILTTPRTMEEEGCDCGCNSCSVEKDDSEEIKLSPNVLSGIVKLVKMMVLEDADDAVTQGGTYVCEGCLYEYMDGINESSLEEAEYHGHKVQLGKKMKGDVKKSKVYVRNPKTGKVIKVNFGDKKMRIKKSSPSHRASFNARHHCSNPGPKTKARYWSCKAWKKGE
jgi:hypothetical protein